MGAKGYFAQCLTYSAVMAVTPAEAMRKMRANAAYRQKGLEYQRGYRRRNRDLVLYVAKCRAAGIDMTMAKAREILRHAPGAKSDGGGNGGRSTAPSATLRYG
jgi:hypothetical protein